MRLRVMIPILLLSLISIAALAQETIDPTTTTDTTITTTETTTVDPAEPTQTDTMFPDSTVDPAPFPDESATTTTYYEDEDFGNDAEEEGALACAACAAIGLAGPLIFLGLSIAIAIWMWRDAKSRNDQYAPLWGIVGFLFNLLGLIIYLVVRSQKDRPNAPPPAAPPPTV